MVSKPWFPVDFPLNQSNECKISQYWYSNSHIFLPHVFIVIHSHTVWKQIKYCVVVEVKPMVGYISTMHNIWSIWSWLGKTRSTQAKPIHEKIGIDHLQCTTNHLHNHLYINDWLYIVQVINMNKLRSRTTTKFLQIVNKNEDARCFWQRGRIEKMIVAEQANLSHEQDHYLYGKQRNIRYRWSNSISGYGKTMNQHQALEAF